MKVQFPIKGLVDGVPSSQQPIQTSVFLKNVRPYDVLKEQTGGQRPGTILAYDTQISGESHPVLLMTNIVTTYITPE